MIKDRFPDNWNISIFDSEHQDFFSPPLSGNGSAWALENAYFFFFITLKNCTWLCYIKAHNSTLIRYFFNWPIILCPNSQQKNVRNLQQKYHFCHCNVKKKKKKRKKKNKIARNVLMANKDFLLDFFWQERMCDFQGKNIQFSFAETIFLLIFVRT